jgi:two-component system, cell cycle response regulator DivK
VRTGLSRCRDVVLLIQPALDERDMYAYYLDLRGFTVLIADTPDEGLRRAGEAAVIVTGIRMPGPFDGVELVEHLRAGNATKHLPIVVLIACAYETDRQRALAAGCDVFLPKPCQPDHLASEIRALLSRHRHVPKPPTIRARETERQHRRAS